MTGILVGIAEIFVGTTMVVFLQSFGILAEGDNGTQFPAALLSHPTLALIAAALTNAVMRFIASTIPNTFFEVFSTRIRAGILHNTLETPDGAAALSLGDVSHILTNLLGKGASCVVNGVQALVAFCLIVTLGLGMLKLSPTLTLLAGLSFAVFALPLIVVRRSFQHYAEWIYRDTSRFVRDLMRDMGNMVFIRIIGANFERATRLRQIAASINRNQVQYIIRVSATGVAPGLIGVGVLVVVVIGNHRMNAVTAEALVPFVYLLTRLAGSISALSSSSAQMTFGARALQGLIELAPRLVDTAPKSNAQACRDRDRIFAARLTSLVVADAAIGRGHVLLENINIAIGAGQMLVIAGASGRGKTTLLLTLIGLLPPIRGQVLWNGCEISDGTRTEFCQQLGYAGPDPYLFEGSVTDNLLFGHPATTPTEHDIKDALHCSCADFVFDLPGALSHRLRDDGEGISAGQKQRLALARAILRKPSVLILDEATANIDESTESEILIRIRRRHPSLIILAVSHRSSMRANATEIMEM